MARRDHDLSHYDYRWDRADMGDFYIHDPGHLHGNLFAARCVREMASFAISTSRFRGIPMVCIVGDRKTINKKSRTIGASANRRGCSGDYAFCNFNPPSRLDAPPGPDGWHSLDVLPKIRLSCLEL